jgi:hypothetical protein
VTDSALEKKGGIHSNSTIF